MVIEDQKADSFVDARRRRAWRCATASVDDVFIWVGATIAIVLMVSLVVGGWYLNDA